MRGFDTANSIFIDGVRDLGNVTRDMFNYEQIEVFKGPAGTGRWPYSDIRLPLTSRLNMPNSKTTNSATLGSAPTNTRAQQPILNKKINETTALRVNVMGENADGIRSDGVENKKWALASSLGFGLGTDFTRIFRLSSYRAR